MIKKILLVLLLIVTTCNVSFSQEWLTSLEVAKKLALIQNKMIFAVWEDMSYDPYLVVIDDPKEGLRVVDLFANDDHNKIIWEYFVPLLIPEYKYEDLLDDIKEKRNLNYMQKFNDDNIKIMDANGNILNTNSSQNKFYYTNLSSILENYALNTSFLKQELDSYSYNQNFTTSFRLAAKYLDFAIFANKSLKMEIAELSDIYLQEAISNLEISDLANKQAIEQKIELLKIKKYVILNKPKKAFRMLKKLDDSQIDSINRSLFAFLNYATFRLLNKVEESMKWQNEVSLADLKKIKYIIEKT